MMVAAQPAVFTLHRWVLPSRAAQRLPANIIANQSMKNLTAATNAQHYALTRYITHRQCTCMRPGQFLWLCIHLNGHDQYDRCMCGYCHRRDTARCQRRSLCSVSLILPAFTSIITALNWPLRHPRLSKSRSSLICQSHQSVLEPTKQGPKWIFSYVILLSNKHLSFPSLLQILQQTPHLSSHDPFTKQLIHSRCPCICCTGSCQNPHRLCRHSDSPHDQSNLASALPCSSSPDPVAHA